MISKEELLDETYGLLEPLKEFKSGLLVYNKPHFKENFVDITDDLKEIKKRLKWGWELRPAKRKFILRAPEAVLCDLSEVCVNPTINLKEILTLFRILKFLDLPATINRIGAEYFPGLEVVPLRGKYSDLEIRIAGSDTRVLSFPKLLYKILRESKLWKSEFAKVGKFIRERKLGIKTKIIKKCTQQTQNFYKKLSEEYSIFGNINLPKVAVYGFWKDLPQADVYIFVPKAGLKYAFGFIEEIGTPQKVMLWECHLSLDMTKELRIFTKELKNKTVAIIDRSYSSNTLDYLGAKIATERGMVIKFALFPKSRRAIQHSDKIFFLDKWIDSKAIRFQGNWGEDLFIRIVNNEDLL